MAALRCSLCGKWNIEPGTRAAGRENICDACLVHSVRVSDETPTPRPKGYPLVDPRKLGYGSDAEILNFMSQSYHVPTIDLDAYEAEPEALALVPKGLCTVHVAVPISRAGRALIVAMSDPTNVAAIDELQRVTGLRIQPVVASEAAIGAAIARYHPDGT